eukprot:2194807-Rhodomonas_salina.1
MSVQQLQAAPQWGQEVAHKSAWHHGKVGVAVALICRSTSELSLRVMNVLCELVNGSRALLVSSIVVPEATGTTRNHRLPQSRLLRQSVLPNSRHLSQSSVRLHTSCSQLRGLGDWVRVWRWEESWTRRATDMAALTSMSLHMEHIQRRAILLEHIQHRGKTKVQPHIELRGIPKVQPQRVHVCAVARAFATCPYTDLELPMLLDKDQGTWLPQAASLSVPFTSGYVEPL